MNRFQEVGASLIYGSMALGIGTLHVLGENNADARYNAEVVACAEQLNIVTTQSDHIPKECALFEGYILWKAASHSAQKAATGTFFIGPATHDVVKPKSYELPTAHDLTDDNVITSQQETLLQASNWETAEQMTVLTVLTSLVLHELLLHDGRKQVRQDIRAMQAQAESFTYNYSKHR